MTHFSCFSFSLQESSQFQELAKERNFYIKLCKTLIKHLVWFMHTSSPLFSDRCIYCIWTVEPRITILMHFFTKDSFHTRHCKATTFTHMVSSHHIIVIYSMPLMMTNFIHWSIVLLSTTRVLHYKWQLIRGSIGQNLVFITQL